MLGKYDIVVKVLSQEGTCLAGHRPGDEIHIGDKWVRGDICLSALTCMMPKVYAMYYDCQLPWLEDKAVATHPCPDRHNPVVFEIRRVAKQQEADAGAAPGAGQTTGAPR
jgi:uncharacterized repeat protein (TIGR04076 family)